MLPLAVLLNSLQEPARCRRDLAGAGDVGGDDVRAVAADAGRSDDLALVASDVDAGLRAPGLDIADVEAWVLEEKVTSALAGLHDQRAGDRFVRVLGFCPRHGGEAIGIFDVNIQDEDA